MQYSPPHSTPFFIPLDKWCFFLSPRFFPGEKCCVVVILSSCHNGISMSALVLRHDPYTLYTHFLGCKKSLRKMGATYVLLHSTVQHRNAALLRGFGWKQERERERYGVYRNIEESLRCPLPSLPSTTTVYCGRPRPNIPGLVPCACVLYCSVYCR